MPLIQLPEFGLQYYLVAFDAAGREQEWNGEKSSLRLIEEAHSEDVTDVFLFSHGWKGDVPTAKAQYRDWVGAMAGCRRDFERMPGAAVHPFRPILVGLHWPSLPWGIEQLHDHSYTLEAEADEPAEEGEAASHEDLVDGAAARIADSEAARDALRTIFQAAETDIAPRRLSPEVRSAVAVLCHEAGLDGERVGADPGRDHEPFDPDKAYALARSRSDQDSLGEWGLGGILDLLRQLSFWKMKDRARRFGEGSAGRLLRDLQEAVGIQRGVRFHLMGHSFGCIVASAMLSGAPNPPRPVDSLLLVQGALSLWSYCKEIGFPPYQPGYFHGVIADGLVRGPILATMSVHDDALGTWYNPGVLLADQVDFDPEGPVAMPWYGAVGTYGIRGTGLAFEDRPMNPSDLDYGFTRGAIVNLESSDHINKKEGIAGAHNSIAVPGVAHAAWEAARVGAELSEAERGRA